jgi:hypothetical protein
MNQCYLTKDNENLNKLKKLTETLPPINMEAMVAFDALDMLIYIADMDTFEILFINKYTANIFGNVEGQICYEVFQGFDKPCSFCTNGRIKEMGGKPYKWIYNNPHMGRTYIIKDKIIPWVDGRIARLEIAMDITDIEEEGCPCVNREN